MITTHRQIARDVARAHGGTVQLIHVEHALDVLENQIAGELRTASDSLEDWRDVDEDEVARLEREVVSLSRGAE